MVLRLCVSFSFFLIISGLFTGAVIAQNKYNEKQLEVALRTIGHQLLQKSGDSVSRVMPISREKERYKIEFESAFHFMPETLFHTVSTVVKKANITKPFIVEVEDCLTGQVVYNYEIDSATQLNHLPCGGREYPTACYNIFFTIKVPGISYPMQSVVQGKIVTAKKISKAYYALGALALLFLSVFLFKKKNKKEQVDDPNLLSIGDFEFDKRNANLSLNDQQFELSGKEASLLLLLHENINETVERDEILNKVWGDEGDYIGRTLDVFISKLRKKLEGDAKVKIVNIRGVGYKLSLIHI